jgi:hypothetical protein
MAAEKTKKKKKKKKRSTKKKKNSDSAGNRERGREHTATVDAVFGINRQSKGDDRGQQKQGHSCCFLSRLHRVSENEKKLSLGI